MPMFERYIGIDYSGAKTPTESLNSLRVFACDATVRPAEVEPPPSPRKYWTRQGLAEWLTARLGEEVPTLVGMDHAFSFPMEYFDRYKLSKNWDSFLDDFCEHWPTQEPHMYVEFIRNGTYGNGAMRKGDSRWRRLTERRTNGAKSVFHFDVPGSVAKSTHAGLPWLWYVRQQRRESVHFWAFDGWEVVKNKHLVLEVFPSLWRDRHPKNDRTPDQHDAYSVCRWLAESTQSDTFNTYLKPDLSADEHTRARIEGWILGVM